LNALKTRLDAILLLRESESGQPLTNRIRLELDPEATQLPLDALPLERGRGGCSGCFVTEVPLYHPQEYRLMGVATFHANARSLEALLTDVRSTLFWTGGAILILIAMAWVGVIWLLRRLSESESNLSAVLDVAPFPILLLEAQAPKIRRANRAAVRYLDLAADGAGRLGSRVWEALLNDGLPSGEDEQREVQLEMADGQSSWAMVSVAPVNFSGATHPLISLVDVSELKLIQQRLHQAANTDGLTKSYNRRYLFARLAEEIERADREGSTLSVILFDLDHFKSINDTFGHAVGDMVLERSAAIMRQRIRGTDVCGRYGGEEFLVILPSASKATALELAERIRAGIKAEPWPQPGLQVSISGGVAEHTGAELDHLLEAADRNLYRAKNTGRDRIVA
jgi:diguanylate cyclase (GGDEF)-like protein